MRKAVYLLPSGRLVQGVRRGLSGVDGCSCGGTCGGCGSGASARSGAAGIGSALAGCPWWVLALGFGVGVAVVQSSAQRGR
jgi:hypothetical protein